jgi:FkbM family methyltransferase
LLYIPSRIDGMFTFVDVAASGALSVHATVPTANGALEPVKHGRAVGLRPMRAVVCCARPRCAARSRRPTTKSDFERPRSLGSSEAKSRDSLRGMSSRSSLLMGLLLGLVVGGAVGVFAGWQHGLPEPSPIPPAADDHWPFISYAQQGEDLILRNVFDKLEIKRPTYIDIGAYHPFVHSNTYLFYRAGGHGVLVEPNPAFTDALRKGRPRDHVLPIGIGLTDDSSADYYVMWGPGEDNTFSKQQAEELVKQHGPQALMKVIKLPLRKLNRVLDDEFPQSAPDLFSIDIEGLDLEVLKSLDFARHRPKVICVETTPEGAAHAEDRITVLLSEHGYVKVGGNLVNSIFVDAKLLSK